MSTLNDYPDSKLKNLNTFSAVLLGVFTVTSFVANIFLLTTIASSYHLRHTIFYYHVLHVACINLAYTSIHSLLSMLYVSTGEWRLGAFACSLNSFVGELLGIETMYGITLMTVDRAVALMSISKYESRMTVLRTLVIVAGCWLVGVVITFPVLIDSIPSEPYRARLFCSVANGNPLGYPLATAIVCYVFPMLVAFWSIGTVLFRMHKDRMRKRDILPDRMGDYTDFIVDNRRVQKHMELAKFSVVAFLVYYSLQGPYYTFKFFSQIRNSNGISDDLGGDLDAPDAETVITLLYSLFLVVFPPLTFCFAKDIWKKFQDLICCRKTNVVSTSVDAAQASNRASTFIAPGDTKVVPPDIVPSNVLTIMTTETGIHQIRPGRDAEYADVPQRDHQRIVDKSRSQQKGRRQRDDTSDYDSEDSDTFGEADPDVLKKSANTGDSGDRTVTAHVFKTELVDGAMRKTRQEIDSSTSPLKVIDLSNTHNNALEATIPQREQRISSSKSRRLLPNIETDPPLQQNFGYKLVDDAASHKRSKSESETNRRDEDIDADRPTPMKRKSLDETVGNGVDEHRHRLPTLPGRRSSARLLNPGAVPSPISSLRINKSRLAPLTVPNMPDNRSRVENIELKHNDNKRSDEKIRKISTSKKY